MHCKSYTHFFSKKIQHICVSLDVNFNESFTNDIVSFEQLGPGILSSLKHSKASDGSVCGQRRKALSDDGDAQADLNLRCLHMLKGMFSRGVAKMENFETFNISHKL